MSGLNLKSSSAAGVTIRPTSLSLQNSFESATTRMGTEALQRRPPATVEFFVSTRMIARTRQIISYDDPRFANRALVLLRALLLPHSVSVALNAAHLLPTITFSVLLPCFPLSPFCRLIAAMLAAIACLGVFRPEYATAVFQQTRTGARPSRFSPGMGSCSFCLILKLNYLMFTRAHGSCLSQKLKPRGGPIPLRGARSTIGCNILNPALRLGSVTKPERLLVNRIRLAGSCCGAP